MNTIVSDDVNDPGSLTPQQRFDMMYITSTEIARVLKVERSSILHARARGILPEPIVVVGVRSFLWERKQVQPHLDAWAINLAARRGELK